MLIIAATYRLKPTGTAGIVVCLFTLMYSATVVFGSFTINNNSNTNSLSEVLVFFFTLIQYYPYTFSCQLFN